MKTLSIILPVYNNQDELKKNIGYLTEFFNQKAISYEIIIVDDCSSNAGEIIEIADDYNCLYIRNEKNSGKGESVKRGMLKASGKYRLFTDADIPYEKEGIELMLEKLDKEKFDVVIGDRTLFKSEYKNGSFLRSTGSRIFSLIVRELTSGKFPDTQCGLKGFTAESAETLFRKTKIKGFAVDVELLYLALMHNYKIGKVPVKLRSHSVSTVSVIKHGFQMVVDLMKIKIYRLRKKYE
ncbi:MAG: glycosyltransferase [Ignavibacteriae bacterium]|nr:glycosyltransferase [Ignavibacteriota bacterium]